MNTFEIVTALTIGSIGTIILLYIIVLKKKGWLTDENPSGTSYLCPNPGCRKVFQKPVTLTDLSTFPARAYLACPHCGLDLETISPARPDGSKPDERIFAAKQPQLRTKDLAAKIENPKPDANVNLKTTKPSENSKPIPDTEPPKITVKPSPPPEAEPRLQTQLKSAEPPNIREEKKQQSERPRACSHHFGYVRTLPKNTSIPDECLWCPWIVDCLAGKQKVEA